MSQDSPAKPWESDPLDWTDAEWRYMRLRGMWHALYRRDEVDFEEKWRRLDAIGRQMNGLRSAIPSLNEAS